VRFSTPHRKTPFLALAPAPSGPEPAERERARKLVAAAAELRKPAIDRLALAPATGRPLLAQEALAAQRAAGEACQLEAFELALALASEHATVAFYAQEGWVDGLRGGLTALLAFFEEEPELASYLVVHSAQAGDRVLARRAEVIDRIARLLDDECAPARSYPPRLTAHAVASGVLGVLHERVARPTSGPLIELVGELMSFTVLPFLGVRAARRELERARGERTDDDALAPGAGLDLVKDAAGRLSVRTVSVLAAIGGEPGLNSKQVAERAGVKDEGQASRLLARLQRLGLIEDVRGPGKRFAAKAWHLTSAGEKLEAAVERAAATPEPSSAVALPAEFVGRLDDGSRAMLRLVGDEPWLRTAELAERAGLARPTQARKQLQSLLDLALAVCEREAHQRGTPNVWSLTPTGEELHCALARQAPAASRSVAAELMRESGGRLSDRSISVLRALVGERGLANTEIAARVGITDQNSTSKLLAGLARQGLLTNARSGGKQNSWRLSSAGEMLERAIWHETPAPQKRKLALDLLRGRGGRLNHRVVSVLREIAAQPGQSNAEIAALVGIEAKGHTSVLLSRLAGFGLIENLVLDPAPFQANAWALTATGAELEAAVRSERRASSTGPSRSARRASTRAHA
jgi:DNA-binding MarR family transcriptional regulator